LDLPQQLFLGAGSTILRDERLQDPQDGVQLVNGSVSSHARMVLGDAASVSEGRVPLIARLRINPG
jgi:hypothetical protein